MTGNQKIAPNHSMAPAVWPLAIFAFGLFLTGLAGIPASNLQAEGFQALEVTVMRTASVGAAFYLLAMARWVVAGRPSLSRDHVKALVSFAVFGVVLTNGGTTLSVALVPSYISIPIIFAMSIATAILINKFANAAVDKLEIGVAVALVLLVAALVQTGSSGIAGFQHWAILIPIVTGVAQGVAYHAVAGGKDMDALTFYALGFGIGGAVMAACAGAFGLVDFKVMQNGILRPEVVGWVTVLAVGMTVVPYLMIRASAPKLSMTAKGSCGAAEPVGGVMADYIQGHQLETARLFLVAVIVTVVALNQKRKSES